MHGIEKKEFLVKAFIYSLAGVKNKNKEISFFYLYLLFYFNGYKSNGNYYSILLWIDEKIIENKICFIDAMSKFVSNLNYTDYDKIPVFTDTTKQKSNLVLDKYKLVVEEYKHLEVVIPSTQIKNLNNESHYKNNKKEKLPIKNDNFLRIEFLGWLDKSLIDNYGIDQHRYITANKRTEQKSFQIYQMEVREWISDQILLYQKLLGETGNDSQQMQYEPDFKEEEGIDSETPLLETEVIATDATECKTTDFNEVAIIKAELEIVEASLDAKNYKILVSSLEEYFKNGSFPENKISVSRQNVKRFGWVLNQIYKRIKDDNSALPFEYLQFAKLNISIFANVEFEKKPYNKSNLYKYFHEKTP